MSNFVQSISGSKPIQVPGVKKQASKVTFQNTHTLSTTQGLNQADHFQVTQSKSPWHLKANGPMSSSLLAQAHKTSSSELQAMLKDLPLMGTLSLWSPNDTRSPNQIIRSALAAALKDQKITVPEALELRGLLLQLPRSEREQYKPLLAQLPAEEYVSPIFQGIDLSLRDYKDFSPADFSLMDSTAFKLVFPNFTALSLQDQSNVLKELKVFLEHFPTLIPALNGIQNDNYGPGFQFFFVTKESNSAFDSVLPKNTSGVIMPGPNSVKDPLLGLVAKKISLRILDRGGMYTSAIKHGVFTHEFAHVIHLNLLSDDQRDKIKNLYDSAWIKHKQTQLSEGFVSNYAQTNPYEYFAEGIEFFLTGNQARLQQKDPALHQFVQQIFAEGASHRGHDGNLLTDPERVHAIASSQGGNVLGGISISRESDLVSIRHFEGSVTQEIQILGNKNSALTRGSIGLKAGWKPWDKPASAYATVGGVAQAGALSGKLSVGAGGYAGIGVDYGAFNAEVRQNWMAGKNTPTAIEVRIGFRFEF